MKNLLLGLVLLFSLGAMSAEVDLKKSKFKWKGTKVTGEHFGEVSLKSASVEMKDGKLTNGNFVIDLKSMTVTDLQGEWADKFLLHMKNEDFFDVEKFPTATLKLTKDDGKKLYGKMTIRGKTNDISFSYKKSGKTYSGKMVFNRTKYDMVYGSGSFFKNLGDKIIHDEVHLDFSVVLK